MSCPNCKGEDWKLASLIYNEGLSSNQSTSTGVAVGAGGIGVGSASSVGSSQTHLSKMAAPPADPQNDLMDGAGIFFALIIGGISYLIGGFVPMLVGGIVGAFLGIFVAAMLPDTAYEQRYAAWKKSRMCLRCGHFYAPAEGA
jgi:hypothetical protein